MADVVKSLGIASSHVTGLPVQKANPLSRVFITLDLITFDVSIKLACASLARSPRILFWKVMASPSKSDADASLSRKRGAPGQLIAVRDGGGGMLTCALCGAECACSECTPYSSSSWACKKCKSNYNRQTERNKVDAILKKWWQGLSAQEKQQ